MLNKGFYFAYEETELIGIAFSIGYIKPERDFQICLQLGTLALAIGYQF